MKKRAGPTKRNVSTNYFTGKKLPMFSVAHVRSMLEGDELEKFNRASSLVGEGAAVSIFVRCWKDESIDWALFGQMVSRSISKMRPRERDSVYPYGSVRFR